MTNIAAAITEVKALLGQRLNTSKSVCELHGQNETYFPKMLPNAVAFPHNTLEVSKVVKICEKYSSLFFVTFAAITINSILLNSYNSLNIFWF